MTAPRFYVAVRGNEPARRYRSLGVAVEELGFDRIYVYNDLMYHPAWPILTLIAEHTSRIELGPCLVNGFSQHPALIAEHIAFLDDLSGGRVVLGLGRGAFFDFLDMDDSELTTRQGAEETVLLVKRFLRREGAPFAGKHFRANEKAVFRIPPKREDVPLVVGSWNPDMARLAGKLCNELQVAEVWDTRYLEMLLYCLRTGTKTAGAVPNFSIGSITCIDEDEERARKEARATVAVYLPYLGTVLSRSGFDPHASVFREIGHLSKRGETARAAALVPNSVIDSMTLTGTPDQAVARILRFAELLPLEGVLISPPYAARGTVEERLELVAKKVIGPVREALSATPVAS